MASKENENTNATETTVKRVVTEVLKERGLIVEDVVSFPDTEGVQWIIKAAQPTAEDILRMALVPTLVARLDDDIRLNKMSAVLSAVNTAKKLTGTQEIKAMNVILVAPRKSMRVKQHRSLITEDGHVQLIPIERLMYNALRHTLVPKHIHMSMDELKKHAGGKERIHDFVEAMQHIGLHDPINVLLGGIPGKHSSIGSVYEIRRNDITSSIAYRRVVADYGHE